MKFRFRYLLLVVVAVLLYSCKQEHKVREIPVNDFFKSRDKSIYRLSPNGKFLSYLSLKDNKQLLIVEDLETKQSTVVSQPDERTIVFYAWVSDNEIIFYKEKNGVRFQTDLYIVNKNGTDKRLLVGDGKSKVRLIEDQLFEEKYLMVTSNQRDSTVFDVYKLNVRNGEMVIAAKNPGAFTSWLIDNEGLLRMAISSDGNNESIWYRANEKDDFHKITTNNFKNSLSPIAFSEHHPDKFFAISNVGRDKNALVEMNVKTGKEEKILFENDSLNITEVQYSKRRSTIDYVVTETWKKEKQYLSKESKDLYDKLEKLLPNAEINIANHDKDEKHFILRTFTDQSPGSYYFYDANTNGLKKLSDINPLIKEDEMCAMRPISYIADDGLKINGYLTLPKGVETKNLPVVVIPNSNLYSRFSWGYNADVQFLANRGYAVLQINYRGSSGYGKAFYSKGFKEIGEKIRLDIDAGVRWLIQQKIANPKRIAIYGYGLGGLISVNAVMTNPTLYNCAASNNGVLNLFSYLKSIPSYRYANLQAIYEIIGNPDTDADYLRQVSPVFHVNRMHKPIFIAQNAKDPFINSNDAIQYVKELTKMGKPVTYLEKPDAKSLLEREESRKKTYEALERFLSTNLKQP